MHGLRRVEPPVVAVDADPAHLVPAHHWAPAIEMLFSATHAAVQALQPMQAPTSSAQA
jgi:hypothetical protein